MTPWDRYNQAGLVPTEPCNGGSRFQLSSGFEWGGYYSVVHSTGLFFDGTGILCPASPHTEAVKLWGCFTVRLRRCGAMAACGFGTIRLWGREDVLL